MFKAFLQYWGWFTTSGKGPSLQWGQAATERVWVGEWTGFGGAVSSRAPLFSLSCSCSGDSYSSSPASTPMGSIESLSSHSSEQNSNTKPASCQPREKSGGIPWIASPSPSNGQKSLGLWTTSPESSSREDATKTDAESDCQSVASVTSPGDVSPPIDLTKKGPHGISGQKRASATFLKSISAAEGKPEFSLCKMSLTPCHLPDYSAWLSKGKMGEGLIMLI